MTLHFIFNTGAIAILSYLLNTIPYFFMSLSKTKIFAMNHKVLCNPIFSISVSSPPTTLPSYSCDSSLTTLFTVSHACQACSQFRHSHLLVLQFGINFSPQIGVDRPLPSNCIFSLKSDFFKIVTFTPIISIPLLYFFGFLFHICN